MRPMLRKPTGAGYVVARRDRHFLPKEVVTPWPYRRRLPLTVWRTGRARGQAPVSPATWPTCCRRQRKTFVSIDLHVRSMLANLANMADLRTPWPRIVSTSHDLGPAKLHFSQDSRPSGSGKCPPVIERNKTPQPCSCEVRGAAAAW
jgi:hypothetical protein